MTVGLFTEIEFTGVFMQSFSKYLLVLMSTLVWHVAVAASVEQATSSTASSPVSEQERIPQFQPRFGRTRPLVAVVGENSGTVVSDFVIPYGVLAQSGVADVVSLGTQPGLLRLSPLTIKPDSTVAEFDKRFPNGADYVFVPAVEKRDDPTLISWVASQASKGATMISICNGAIVLANAGITKGHRATGHWSTYDERVKKFPDTQWIKNIRYVVDGKIVSSAGITAAVPTSLALVEAIAGNEWASQLAQKLGVPEWGTKHNSDQFRFEPGDIFSGIASLTVRSTDSLGLPVMDGVDEIALSLTAEAYTATLRSRVFVLAKTEEPVKTKGGLVVVPDKIVGQGRPLDRVLPEWDNKPSTHALDYAIKDIAERYGRRAARFVALEAEYPSEGL
jgi:transcriptional regulator GlxA family with amidase domain